MQVSIDCRYIRERPSGIGAYVQALVDGLPALAPEYAFHFWASPRAKRPLSRAPNTTETVVAAPSNGLRTLLCPSLLADLRQANLVHFPFDILGRGIRSATVVTMHDLMWLLHPHWSEGVSPATPFQALFYRDGILRALRHATRLISISQATADSIARHAPYASSRVRVIRHGIAAHFQPPADRAALRSELERVLGSTTRYFLVIGQNAPYKNHSGILKAFARANLPKHTRIVFLQRLFAKGRWATFGVERSDELARSLHIEDRAVWLDGISQADLVRLYQGALALVQFSRFEGFGFPALEALACGTPLIASDIEPLREVSGGAAIHVPLEIDALARAMQQIATTPSLTAELSARGIERAKDFSWQRAVREHLEVYREVLAERG